MEFYKISTGEDELIKVGDMVTITTGEVCEVVELMEDNKLNLRHSDGEEAVYTTDLISSVFEKEEEEVNPEAIKNLVANKRRERKKIKAKKQETVNNIVEPPVTKAPNNTLPIAALADMHNIAKINHKKHEDISSNGLAAITHVYDFLAGRVQVNGKNSLDLAIHYLLQLKENTYTNTLDDNRNSYYSE